MEHTLNAASERNEDADPADVPNVRLSETQSHEPDRRALLIDKTIPAGRTFSDISGHANALAPCDLPHVW
jgi:hypothetical protein